MIIPPGSQPPEESLDESELRAIRTLSPELEEHDAFTQSAFDFLQRLLAAVPEIPMPDMPPSTKVAISLLARLSNDLRCTHWLAHRGYAVQAGTLVASMFEVAFTVLFIGSDDALAQEWIDHEEPTQSFRNVWTLTREGLMKLDVADPDAQAFIEYRVYSQLCMARHANPLFQTQHSFREVEEGTVSPIVGPDVPDSLRGAQFSLQHGGGLCFLAGASFIKEDLEKRLPRDAIDALVETMRSVGRLMNALKQKAKTRWGTEDPFPGKWRHAGQGGPGGPTPA